MSHVPFGGPPPELLKNGSTPPRNTRPTTPRPYYPSRNAAVPIKNLSRERIPPMKVTPKSSYTPHVKKLSRPKKTRRSDPQKTARFHDFLLGFFIGLAIFGIAAIFLCNALIALFM